MTTIKNEAKRLARAMYIKGLIPSLEKRDTAEAMIEQTLQLFINNQSTEKPKP